MKWEVNVTPLVQLSLLHVEMLCVRFLCLHRHMGSDTEEEL